MKKIFITGISSGIGYEAVQFFKSKGYQVYGSVRSVADKNLLLNEFGNNIEVVLFDLTDAEAIKLAAEEVKSKLDGQLLDGIINNAGVAIPGPLYYMADDEFRLQIDVNLLGVRLVTNAFLPLLGFPDQIPNKSTRKIINISSVSGLFTVPFNAAYCISKHALESMTDAYRRELHPFDIDVIAVEPGPIKSKIWEKNIGVMDKYLDTPYSNLLQKADAMIENSAQSALPAEEISRLLFHIMESSRPKTRYLVHRKKFLFTLLSKYIPDRIADKLIWKNFKKDKYRPV